MTVLAMCSGCYKEKRIRHLWEGQGYCSYECLGTILEDGEILIIGDSTKEDEETICFSCGKKLGDVRYDLSGKAFCCSWACAEVAGLSLMINEAYE